MAINPLELQVNLSQTNQVGKQQTMMQGAELIRQDKAGEQILKSGEKNGEYVPETKDLSEGPDRIKDEKKNKENSKKNSKQKSKLIKKQVEKAEIIEKLKDPDLGHNIDILG